MKRQILTVQQHFRKSVTSRSGDPFGINNSILLLIIWTIKDYAIAYVLTKGGPSRATELLTIYIQQTGFKYFDFGKASAAGMLMLLVALAFTFFYFKVLNKEEE